MNIVKAYSPEAETLLIIVSSTAIDDSGYNYIKDVVDRLNKDPEIDEKNKPIYISQGQGNSVTVSFKHSFDPETDVMIDSERIGVLSSGIGPIANEVMKAVAHLLSKHLSNLEFLPMKGYSLENLRSELDAAIENKRDLAVHEFYNDWKEMNALNKSEFPGIKLEYGTDEWADVILDFKTLGSKELVKKYKPMLTEITWI